MIFLQLQHVLALIRLSRVLCGSLAVWKAVHLCEHWIVDASLVTGGEIYLSGAIHLRSLSQVHVI